MKAKHYLSAFLAGLTGGLITGLMVAPKSGKELREDIKKRTKDLSKEATEKYVQAQEALTKKIKNLKKAGEKIDKAKYTELVNEVVQEFKSNSTVTKETAEKLGKLLREDFETLVGSLKSETKKK